MAAEEHGKKRVIITDIDPWIDCGRINVKRTIGEEMVVGATIFADGHERISASLLHKSPSSDTWERIRMRQVEPRGLDKWEGTVRFEEIGKHLVTIQGWVDHLSTWKEDLMKKFLSDQDVEIDLEVGINLMRDIAKKSDRILSGVLNTTADGIEKMKKKDQEGAVKLASEEISKGIMAYSVDPETQTTFEGEIKVWVERRKALFSTWYELFPRSFSNGEHGLSDLKKMLPYISDMGFDVLYLPPIHPIGITNRKGRNNTTNPDPKDPGSPWAIGSSEGGHLSVHPELGTIDDLKGLIQEASGYGIEIALDLAFQCSPDHPYVKEHPGWFRWRPDGTIQYAENPPKKYEDIVPLDFEADDWVDLWNELLDVALFWIEAGIKIFRVDNPHTKPVRFWSWFIERIREDYPDIIFLAEAFTRPAMMEQLAKEGFSQSYTYFTWRNYKWELEEYIDQLVNSEMREYFRPNLWPNTPDILPEILQNGGRPAFMIRLILAATLSASYGIYGPPFELCVSEALPGKEEYFDSEKFQEREWNLENPESLSEFIARVNRVRRESPALQTTWNYRRLKAENEFIMAYEKSVPDETLLIIVNLDPFHKQRGVIEVDLDSDGSDTDKPFMVHDLLGDERYLWHRGKNEVELDPHILPARIFKIRTRVKRETDFDYFM